MQYSIQAFDIGGNTKVIPFVGNDEGQLWFSPSFNPQKPIPRVATPHHIPAQRFPEELETVLRHANVWGGDDTLRAFSICSPVVGTTCINLVNRGIHEPFTLQSDALLNDGFAATIGSLVAGVAQQHVGAVACLTLGTGVGFGAVHWDHHGKRVTNDGEAHITIRDGIFRCNCGRKSCFEASANEKALQHYATAAGWDADELNEIDLGFTFEDVLQDPSHEHFFHVKKALTQWYGFLAQGMATIYVVMNMGGTTQQPPALFVMAGGLAALIDEQALQTAFLKEWTGKPLVGSNVIVKKETTLGNKAGAVGVAAEALARKIGKSVFDITFLKNPPK